MRFINLTILTVLVYSALITSTNAQRSSFPELTTIIYEERSSLYTSPEYVGEDCLFHTDFTIHLAHLVQTSTTVEMISPPHDKKSNPDGVVVNTYYTLPAEAPPMFLAYTVGYLTDTIPLVAFDYVETLGSDDEGIPIYGITIPVSVNIAGYCFNSNGPVVEFPWTAHLLTTNGEGGYTEYPVCEHLYGIFDCNAFVETHDYCNGLECVNSEAARRADTFKVHCGDCDGTVKPSDEKQPIATSSERSSKVEEELDAPKFSIVPNPFDQYLLLNIPESEEQQKINIRLFDVSGALVRQEVVNSAEHATQLNITTSQLSPGIYNLHVVQKERSQTFKLVKY
ncbi:MAG: T9SS type A sorting domain-containing protein [Bacteroidota bacterium]